MAEERKDAVVRPATIEQKAVVNPISFQIGTNLWVRWAEIAIESESESARYRMMGVQKGSTTEAFHASLVGELKSSLLAVAASAHALDAFYGSILGWSPVPRGMRDVWKENNTPRHAQILETFKSGFSVGGQEAKRWHSEMKWLFGLRDAAVHFRQEPRDTVPHPGGVSTQVAVEHADYSVESSQRAVELLLDVLQICRGNPKGAIPDSTKWGTDYGALVEILVESRSPGRG